MRAELNRTRRIGVDFECVIPRLGAASGADVQRALAEILSANGLRAVSRNYSSTPVPTGYDLAVEYDSSIRGRWEWRDVPHAELEIKPRILANIDDWEQVIPKAMTICRDMGAQVNKSTAYHVHIDFPEGRNPRHIRSLYNLFHRYERVIYGLVAPSRRTCGYANPIPDAKGLLKGCNTLSSCKRKLAHLDRRNGLNLVHLWNSGPRIELRYHGGSLNATKARMWLRFCLQMVEHAVTRNCKALDQLSNSRESLEKLLITVGFRKNSRIYREVSTELRETSKWLLKRHRHFNSNLTSQSHESTASSEFPPGGPF